MSFEDKTLACRDCGTEFTFTAGEQEFYAQKGFANEPTRCRSCRQTRKMQRNDSPNDRGGYGYNERSYGGGNSYGTGNSARFGQRERVQHEAVCSECGRATTVPFVPRGDRPVYCNDCFAQQRASRPANRNSYNRY